MLGKCFPVIVDSHGRSTDLPEVKGKQEREVYIETCQNDLMSTVSNFEVNR